MVRLQQNSDFYSVICFPLSRRHKSIPAVVHHLIHFWNRRSILSDTDGPQMGLLKLSLGWTFEKSYGTSKMSLRIRFPYNLTVPPSDAATLSRSCSRYCMCRHQVFHTCPILTKTIFSPVATMNTGNSKYERSNISLKEDCKDRLFFFWRLAND